MNAPVQPDHVALGRRVEDRLNRLTRRDRPFGREGGAGGERQHQGNDVPQGLHQVPRGSTSMRPFISMWSAWQNQGQ